MSKFSIKKSVVTAIIVSMMVGSTPMRAMACDVACQAYRYSTMKHHNCTSNGGYWDGSRCQHNRSEDSSSSIGDALVGLAFLTVLGIAASQYNNSQKSDKEKKTQASR